MRAQGTFDVSMTGSEPLLDAGGVVISRMTFNKQFAGDLRGVSRVHFLAVRTPVAGSASYVALEHVTAQLAGRSGAFVLQHAGVMSAEGQKLIVQVVADSGTDELTGLHGTFKIINADGNHSYDFEYDFPAIAP